MFNGFVRASEGVHVDAEPGSVVTLKPGALVKFSYSPHTYLVGDEAAGPEGIALATEVSA